jgi:hypothetical protein
MRRHRVAEDLGRVGIVEVVKKPLAIEGIGDVSSDQNRPPGTPVPRIERPAMSFAPVMRASPAAMLVPVPETEVTSPGLFDTDQKISPAEPK